MKIAIALRNLTPLSMLATIASIAPAAFAQTLTKANNTTNLVEGGSWVQNTVPTTSNVLVFTSGWTPAQVQMGGNLSVSGLEFVTLANATTRISGSVGQTISIGSNGINMSSATNNVRIDPALVLTNNQTWSIASGRILNLVAAGVTSPGGYKATVTGSGTLAFDASGTGTYGNEVEIDVATLRVNQTTTNVTITNAANSYGLLTLFNGRANFDSIGNTGFDSAAGRGTSITQLGGSATNGLFVYTGLSAVTDRGFIVDRRSSASGILVESSGQTLTINGTIAHSLGNDTGIVNNNFRVGGAGNLTLNGAISDTTNASFSTGIAKEGAGTLILGASNSYVGATTIAAGSLGLGSSNRIADASNLVLNGGTFALNGFAETLGSLDLNANATIDLGSTGTLKFADSSGVAWETGMVLTIAGTFNSGSSIQFGSASGTLSGSQLGQIQIAGFQNLALDTSGFLTASAIPEPSTYALLAGIAGLGLVIYRRRRDRAAAKVTVTQKL